MILNRLNTLLFSSALILAIFTTVLVFSGGVQAAITPDREIVTADSPDTPQWKKRWDAARELARKGDYAEAAAYYRELFLLKPRIEEARWEYCKVLFELQEYDTLSTILEGLIENNPNRHDYLALAGDVSLQKEEYERAVMYLGQVYSQYPEGKSGVRALEGLVNGLQGQGKKKFAFPLMEQLYQRKNSDPQLLHDLARYALELAHHEKARDYYTALITRFRVDDNVLLEAAELFDVPGREDEALPLWKQYLKRHPGYLPYHKKLYHYYLAKEQSLPALPHLLHIIEHDIDRNNELLLVAGRIFFQKAGRPDKALYYFERYLAKNPDRDDILSEVGEIRNTLAVNLLAIVENGGTLPLWQDLAQLTSNRLAVFQLMAEKLEKKGKINELLDVLRIIHQHSSDKDAIALRLASIFQQQKRYREALAYLYKITDYTRKTYKYYKNRGQLEEKIGLKLAALKSYTQALKIRQDVIQLRYRALRIAGSFGFLSESNSLYAPLKEAGINEENVDAHLAYIEVLNKNGLYSQASGNYSTLLNKKISARLRTHIRLHQAQSLQQEGKPFESQRVLRMLLVEEPDNRDVVIKLIDFAIENLEIDDGWKWFSYLSGLTIEKSWKTRCDRDSRRVFRSYILLLEAEKNFKKAIDDLCDYRQLLKRNIDIEDHMKVLPDFNKLLCRLYLKRGDYSSCIALVTNQYNFSGQDDVELAVIRQIALSGGKRRSSGELEKIAGKESLDSFPQLLTAAMTEFQLGENEAGVYHLERAEKVFPESNLPRLLLAERKSDIGKLTEASFLFDDLRKKHPEEQYFYNNHLLLNFKLGNYNYITSETAAKDLESLSYPIKLLRARSLWGLNQRINAIEVYQSILTSSAQGEFLRKMNSVAPTAEMESPVDSVWGLFTFAGSEQLSRLNEMADPSYFMPLVSTSEGTVLADMFARIRWEKLVRNEYLARKAVVEKKYITAEKQYKRTLREEKSTAGLMDLAKIYERLGDYKKEAEVYDVIEKEGQEPPQLAESIKRNKIARAPRLSVHFEQLQKQGREGAVDIRSQRGGAEFWFMPEVSSEVLLELSELSYKPESGGISLSGREFSGLGSFKISEDTKAYIGAGVHMLDSEDDSVLLYDLGIEHQLDDLIKGYVKYNQDVVDDTIAALEEGIYSQSLTVGLLMETPSGLNVGGDYRRLRVSDGNTQDRLYLWSEYSFFGEYTTLEFKYDYELQKNSNSHLSTIEESTGIVENDLSYWSPENYWQHRLNMHFQHLLKDLKVFDGAPSYYAIDFSIGYETGENLRYTGSFDIFLEMNSHFLLKGNVLYSKSDDYDERSAFLSLIYRW